MQLHNSSMRSGPLSLHSKQLIGGALTQRSAESTPMQFQSFSDFFYHWIQKCMAIFSIHDWTDVIFSLKLLIKYRYHASMMQATYEFLAEKWCKINWRATPNPQDGHGFCTISMWKRSWNSTCVHLSRCTYFSTISSVFVPLLQEKAGHSLASLGARAAAAHGSPHGSLKHFTISAQNTSRTSRSRCKGEETEALRKMDRGPMRDPPHDSLETLERHPRVLCALMHSPVLPGVAGVCVCAH